MGRIETSHRGIDDDGCLVAGTQSQCPDDGDGKHLLFACRELVLQQFPAIQIQHGHIQGVGIDKDLADKRIFVNKLVEALSGHSGELGYFFTLQALFELGQNLDGHCGVFQNPCVIFMRIFFFGQCFNQLDPLGNEDFSLAVHALDGVLLALDIRLNKCFIGLKVF